ncbi:hypothetical protein Tco_0194204 [Tanacetum coccineum]
MGRDASKAKKKSSTSSRKGSSSFVDLVDEKYLGIKSTKWEKMQEQQDSYIQLKNRELDIQEATHDVASGRQNRRGESGGRGRREDIEGQLLTRANDNQNMRIIKSSEYELGSDSNELLVPGHKEIVIKSEFLKHFGNDKQLKGVFLMEESSTVGVVKLNEQSLFTTPGMEAALQLILLTSESDANTLTFVYRKRIKLADDEGEGSISTSSMRILSLSFLEEKENEDGVMGSKRKRNNF